MTYENYETIDEEAHEQYHRDQNDVEEFYNESKTVANNMIRRGGGFVQHLGEALLRADSTNTLKLKQAFPEYWEQYKK